jgi:hypothetical protein
MNDKLKEIFQHSFDMMKLAETKNAGLIAFNGAVIVGMIKLLKDFNDSCILTYYLVFVILTCCISVFLCLASLVAQLKHKESEVKLTKNDNLLFFGTIAHLTPDELLDKLKSKYNLKSENENYEKDLAKQAVIMSQIAVRKYEFFNSAIAWTFAGIATPLSVLFFKIFYDPNK